MLVFILDFCRKVYMTTRINPPTINKAKTYESFRQELLAWTEITELSKDKQGIAITLSLPDDDESQIRVKFLIRLQLMI